MRFDHLTLNFLSGEEAIMSVREGKFVFSASTFTLMVCGVSTLDKISMLLFFTVLLTRVTY